MHRLIGILCCAVSTPLPLLARDVYRLPPPEVVAIVDAPPAPSVRLSPDSEWMILVERDAMPGIADLSRRMLRLGGVRIDPAASGRFQTGYDRALSLRRRDGRQSTPIPLPDGARLSSTSWAHDSRSLAFTLVSDKGTELWSVSVDGPRKPRRLTRRLSTVLASHVWMPDARSLVCRLVPEERGREPEAPRSPDGPNVQESSGNTSPTRTYQDLLSSPHDEELFEYYATTQLAILDPEGTRRSVGKPAMISDASPSPDGKHLLVTSIERPFSYLMTYRSFPRRIEVWNLDGEVEHLVAAVPLAENIPIQGVRTGPRQVMWKSGEPATLMWLEALDGGDPRRVVDHRDRWMIQAAPFTEKARELLRSEHRSTGVSFLADPSMLISTEYDRDRRWTRSLLHSLSHANVGPRVLSDRSIRDRYADPGRLITVPDTSGKRILLQEGPWVYRSGRGASPEGMLPFLDRQNLETLETQRLWRCEKGAYESVVAIVEIGAGSLPTLVTSHETPASPPNYQLRKLGEQTVERITQFPDPTPQIRGIEKQLVTYKRNDGVPLSATLYLPGGHKPLTRLPLIVWAYPIEFNDARTAGQIGVSPWRFTRIQGSTHLTLLTQGYAIMDRATMPVIGHPEKMNDTFVEQIVASARAAIDKAVEMGVADPDRVGVGGHSYGAFMTANLLAHCDLFRAGIARSGAYNRTLTPFGFQSERRPLWEAKDVYFRISPFMHAHRINEPMLMIHGENDNNSGTFPMQSRRMYQAIKGNGGTVRLVMLPGESHGYRSRESVLHVQAEMIDWSDRYVKKVATNRPPGGANSTR